MKKRNFLAIDYGDSRIGLAIADSKIRIPIPQGVVYNNEQMIEQILTIIIKEGVDTVVVGYPRNQSGEATAQTAKVEQFVNLLKLSFDKIVFQDESLTSVLAEDRLKKYKKHYTKEDIDAQAAVIILEDYLEKR